jgi:CheY-like chemotaxis protein
MSPSLALERHGALAKPHRVLIIEDNVDARQALRALLETLGHEVHEAGDGEAGITAALALRPDVVLVDIGLPRLDGYGVARRLRQANVPMRLVALTGYGRDDDVRRAEEAGFDEHLLKPASADRLRAAIDAAPVAPRGPTKAREGVADEHIG